MAAFEGAARLMKRLERQHRVVTDRAVCCPTAPVRSWVELTQEEQPRTGPLTVVTRSSATTAGEGSCVGAPVRVEDLLTFRAHDAMIVCATREHDYRQVSTKVNAAVAKGVAITGVVTANDEAVLISNRLAESLPVVDDIDVLPLLSATRLAMEVRQGRAPLRHVSDPFWLTSVLGLRPDEQALAQVVADQLRDSAIGIIAIDRHAMGEGPRAQPRAHKHSPVATARHTVDLSAIAAEAGVRRGSVEAGSTVTASMLQSLPELAAGDELEELLGVPVVQVDSETVAAHMGAVTTPGVGDDVTVVDVGGGTVDVISGESRSVLPGAGQMLTAATASALRISKSAAEYAKRSEAVKAISAQLIEDENGRRQFLNEPLDGRSVGWLMAQAPSGLLPFTAALTATEWRNWRHVAKRHVIGANVLSGVSQRPARPAAVLLVGGAAGDDELVRTVSDELGREVTVGRGNVGGMLGHRFAVAYGLVVMAIAGVRAGAADHES